MRGIPLVNDLTGPIFTAAAAAAAAATAAAAAAEEEEEEEPSPRCAREGYLTLPLPSLPNMRRGTPATKDRPVLCAVFTNSMFMHIRTARNGSAGPKQ